MPIKDLLEFESSRAKAEANNKCATVGGRKVFPYSGELYFVDDSKVVVAISEGLSISLGLKQFEGEAGESLVRGDIIKVNKEGLIVKCQ